MSVPQIVMNDDTARTRRTDPLTSHEAADLNDVTASIGAVLDTLTQYGPKADHELHELMEYLGYPYTGQRIRTARASLVDRGLVRDAGYFHLTRRGRRTVVWEVAS